MAAEDLTGITKYPHTVNVTLGTGNNVRLVNLPANHMGLLLSWKFRTNAGKFITAQGLTEDQAIGATPYRVCNADGDYEEDIPSAFTGGGSTQVAFASATSSTVVEITVSIPALRRW